MSIEEIKELLSHVVTVLGVIGVTVEVAPIKFSPLRWIGKRLNADVIKRIEVTEKNVKEIDVRLDKDKVQQLRSELLNFSNSCMNNKKHTDKEFDSIFEKEREYNELCKKHNIKNGYTEDNMNYVHEVYRQCKRAGKFLVPFIVDEEE